jgi:hypothetical protein
MSSEKLENINQDQPKIDQQPTIKFVSDELGLGTPLSQIPTDVEYFLNKQRGVGESTYDFGKATEEAFKIDNLFYSGVNLFTKDSYTERDFNYEITKDQFDIIEQYPEFLRGAFLESKSNDHFYFLKNQVDKRLEVEKELANYGWKGFAARMVASIADPAAIALTVGTGGLLPPLVYGGKIARLKRAVTYGALVGTENAVIEAGLVALDPMKDPNDIRYALYGGYLLGGVAGTFSRTTKFPEIDQANIKLDSVARKAMNNIEIDELNTFAVKNKTTINEDFLRKKRLQDAKLEDPYDFTVTDNPKAASLIDDDKDAIKEIENQWRKGEGISKYFLRFSNSSYLSKSTDNEIRKFSEVFLPDPVIGSSRGDTGLEYKTRKIRQILYPVKEYRDLAYQSFLKSNPEANGMQLSAKIETFNSIISDLREFPELASKYKYVTPQMKTYAQLGGRAFDETLQVVGDSGRLGWGDIKAKGGIKNYFPHIHNQAKLSSAVDEYGLDQVYKVYSNALPTLKTQLDSKIFDRMIKGIVKKISTPRYRGSESIFARAFQGTDEIGLREFLEDLELTKEQIDEIVKKASTKENKLLDPNARRRLDFDINTKTDVKSIKDGTVRSLSIKELMDRNFETVLDRYVNQVIGQAAMARFGGFKTNRDFDNFLARIESRNTDIENELDILKVINASFIGRQNPLETVMGSSDRTRRVMRLIGDYNFLRLFGQVGFAQGSELGSVLGEVGWSTALRTMPELKNIMNRFISGKVAFNDPLLKELDAAGGLNLGLDRFMNSPSARLEGSEDFLSLDKSNVLNNLEIISAKAKRFVADVSLQNPMTSTTQIMGAKALTSKIAENMIVLSDIHKTTDIYKFLKLGDQVRYRQLGWTENQFNEISKNIKQHAKFENSYLKSLGLDDWSVEARSSFTVGLNRWIDKIAAQQTDLATMNKWFTTDFAKLLTQFRTFSIQAYEKQLLNGIYTLHQTRGKDFETWSRFFSSTLMAGLFYTTQVYINSFGLRDREEYLKEKLSASNIGRVSFLRSSWSSLLPLGASTIAYPFTSDDIFGYGRNTELSADLLSGIPTFNLFSNIISSTRTLSKTITDPTYEPSEREIRNGLSLFILHNGLGIKNVNNMVVDYFAK